MRGLIDRERVLRLMSAMGRAARATAVVYFTGGVSAVLMDWRSSTIDVDMKIEPDRDEVMRVLPTLKEELQVNIELASPGDFIPELAGWRERSPFIAREGLLHFCHYDFHAQALSKLERRHARDLVDVEQMYARGLIDGAGLRTFFNAIEPQLYRYPAIDPASFRAAVEDAARTMEREGSS
jgi:hypothetical protein